MVPLPHDRSARMTGRTAISTVALALGDCRFSARQPLDTTPEKTGPTRGERIFGALCADVEPLTPSSRILLAAYRGAQLLIDTPLGWRSTLYLRIGRRAEDIGTI